MAAPATGQSQPGLGLKGSPLPQGRRAIPGLGPCLEIQRKAQPYALLMGITRAGIAVATAQGQLRGQALDHAQTQARTVAVRLVAIQGVVQTRHAVQTHGHIASAVGEFPFAAHIGEQRRGRCQLPAALQAQPEAPRGARLVVELQRRGIVAALAIAIHLDAGIVGAHVGTQVPGTASRGQVIAQARREGTQITIGIALLAARGRAEGEAPAQVIIVQAATGGGEIAPETLALVLGEGAEQIAVEAIVGIGRTGFQMLPRDPGGDTEAPFLTESIAAAQVQAGRRRPAAARWYPHSPASAPPAARRASRPASAGAGRPGAPSGWTEPSPAAG